MGEGGGKVGGNRALPVGARHEEGTESLRGPPEPIEETGDPIEFQLDSQALKGIQVTVTFF